MPKEVVYDNEFATMWYHPDKKIVHHKIHKFIYGEPFHQFLLTGTGLIKKYKARKWLSDDRDNPVLRQEDIEWGAINWIPQTVIAGWKYWAIVTPTKAMGKMVAEKLVADYSKMGIVAKFFDNDTDAMQWLENQN